MCAITGVIPIKQGTTFAASDVPEVRQKLRAMLSRGPDELQVSQLFGVTIGANRLAIVDRSRGHQPMVAPDGAAMLALNGEIYNHLELRRTLLPKDARFATTCDTETLLFLMAHNGLSALPFLNGMFAFVFATDAITFLVRDRFGEKPLYYKQEDGRIVFASEMKALIENQPNVVLPSSYWDYEYACTDDGQTVVDGILEVPPGQVLKIDRASGSVRLHSYYDLLQIASAAVDGQASPARFMNLLRDSVRIRTPKEVKFGTYISGGIDSTLITGLVQPKETIAFIADTEGGRADAKFIADAEYGLNVETVRVYQNLADFPLAAAEIVRAIDVPVGTLAVYSQFLLSREAQHRGYRVMLGGLGADELLSGYVRDLAAVLDPVVLKKLPEFSAYQSMLSRAVSYSDPAQRACALLSREEEPSLDFKRLVAKAFEEARDGANAISVLELRTSFRPLLDVDDKINLHFGVEARAPFLDHRLFECAMGMAAQSKAKQKRRGAAWEIMSKPALRSGSRGLIPEEIRLRKDKVGFPSPLLEWLKGPFQSAVERAVELLKEWQSFAEAGHVTKLQSIGSFSRRSWLTIQWALWRLMFVEGLTPGEASTVIFGPRPYGRERSKHA